MNETVKIVDIESDDSDDSVSDIQLKSSEDGSKKLLYSREDIISIGELPISNEVPENFVNVVENFPDCDYIIFPSVPKPEIIEEKESEDLNRFGVLNCLQDMENFVIEEQIVEFMKLVTITSEQVEAMLEICHALEKVLLREFPEVKAFPFGSSTSGYGLKDCDLDIHIDLGPNANDASFYEKAGLWGVRFRTRKVSDIIRREERFKSAVPIIQARTPIIRLKERRSSVKCDINVVTSMGVKNTKYLAFTRGQDSRCLPLICILKFFSSEQGVTGSGIGNHLNSYTLVLMVVFFLQNKYILHPIDVLQKDVEVDEVQGWNFNFCQDLTLLPKLKPNETTVTKLLTQFFQFYESFDYETFVICPLVGRAIPRIDIKYGKSLPNSLKTAPSFGRKKEKLEVNKALVVQDPFELTRNVGHVVKHGRLQHMVDVFSTAKQLMEDIARDEDVKFWMLFEPGMGSYKDVWLTKQLAFADVENIHNLFKDGEVEANT